MSRNRYLPPGLLLCAALLSGCGGGGGDPSPAPLPVQPPSSSLSISAVLDPDKTYEVGDLAAGWLMRVPKGALGDQPTTLEMRTATDAELITLGVPPDARVLSLTANGQHNVRLQELVEIAAQIPPKLKQASPWELMYGYHMANGWEYWPFKDVDMAAGVAVIETQHFSWDLGPVQPSTAERLTVYSRTMAAQYTQKELARQALVQKLGPDLEQTLASLGVTDRAVIKNLSMNMIAYLESAHIDYALTANAALSPLDSIARIATGNEDERKEKSLEITARALHWALAKGGPGKWPANAIGSFGSLGTAVGALAGGDSEAAGNATYNVLKGVVTGIAPHTGLVFLVGEAAVGSVLNAVDAFTASELEKAYQVYAGHSSGKGYYEEESGDIEALLEQMAGGGRQQETRIIANYCAKRMISPCELSAPDHEYALDKGRASLKAYFEQRMKNEQIYKAFELQEKEFVAELEKDGYLINDSSFNKYFGDGDGGLTFDIEDRLQRIYRVRSSLREIFDGPNAAKMTHRDMVLAIRFWMTNQVNKTVPNFYEWAIEQGYTSSSFKTDAPHPAIGDWSGTMTYTSYDPGPPPKVLGTWCNSGNGLPMSLPMTMKVVDLGENHYSGDTIGSANATVTIGPAYALLTTDRNGVINCQWFAGGERGTNVGGLVTFAGSTLTMTAPDGSGYTGQVGLEGTVMTGTYTAPREDGGVLYGTWSLTKN